MASIKKLSLLFSALLLVALPAAAQARGHGITRVHGIVSSVGVDSITITKTDSLVATLSVVTNTVFVGPDRNSDNTSTLTDLQVGDQIDAASFNGLALGVRYEAAPSTTISKNRGAVNSTTADSIVLTKADQTQSTFSVDANTEFYGPDRNGDGTSGLADLQAGDLVQVEDDGSLALEIKYHPLPAGLTAGVVSAIGADSLTVTKTDGSSVALPVDANTKFRVKDVNKDGVRSLTDVQVGDLVGVHTADGSTLALEVRAGKLGHHGRSRTQVQTQVQTQAKAKAKARKGHRRH